MRKREKHQHVLKLLGWQWWAFTDVAVKSSPKYPRAERVRLFIKKDLSPRWEQYLNDKSAVPADMTEPLAYCYCSSGGHPMPPDLNDDKVAFNAFRSLFPDHPLKVTYNPEMKRYNAWSNHKLGRSTTPTGAIINLILKLSPPPVTEEQCQ